MPANGTVSSKRTQRGNIVPDHSYDRVECPGCGEKIILSELLSNRLRKEAAVSLQRDLEIARTQLEKELSADKLALEAELQSAREEARGARAAQLALTQRERELDDLAAKLRTDADEVLLTERESIRSVERERAERDAQRLLKEKEEDLRVLADRLAQAETNEMELRRMQADVAAREAALELELQRRLDPIRIELTQEITAQAQHSASIELQRRETEISRLREQIAKLSIPTGASELVGESLESILRITIAEACPFDLISDVPKGVKGADLIQRVRNGAQTDCGVIVWECKNTRTFDQNWISKTKEAQRNADGDLAVIVSITLPQSIRHLGQIDGIWICSPAAAGGLAVLLRHLILRVSSAKLVAEARDARLQALVDYIGGSRFRLACESVVRLVSQMERQLESERKSISRIWETRRLQLTSMGTQVVEVVGALEGVTHSELVGDLDGSSDSTPDPIPLLISNENALETGNARSGR